MSAPINGLPIPTVPAANPVAIPADTLLLQVQGALQLLLKPGESVNAQVVAQRPADGQFQLTLQWLKADGQPANLEGKSNRPLSTGTLVLLSVRDDHSLILRPQTTTGSPQPARQLDLQQLPVGSLIQARVLDSRPLPGSPPLATSTPVNHAPLAENTPRYQSEVRLLNGPLQGRTLLLESPQPLPVGSLLSARVQGEQQLQFLPLSSRLDALELRQQLAAQQLRQAPLESLFSKLQGLDPSRLPGELGQQIDKLLQNLPLARQMGDPAHLARAILDSGLFLESRLASNSPPAGVAQDLKGQLLYLVSQLQPLLPGSLPLATQALNQLLPPLLRNQLGLGANATRSPLPFPLPNRLVQELEEEGDLQNLLRLAAAAISRLQSHQLSSLAQSHYTPEGNWLTTWQLELPMRDQQQLISLQARLQEERKPDQQDPRDSLWRLDLSFDLAPLGAMRVQGQLLRGCLSTTLWAEQAPTVQLIQGQLGYLRERLQQAGLSVGELDCRQGTPPPMGRAPLEQRWIDENA